MEPGKKDKIKYAIFLNAFILPGAGHFYIGERIKGVILSIISIFLVFAPVVKYLMAAALGLQIVSQMNNTTALSKAMLTSQTVWPEVRSTLILAVIGILIIWGYGIIDLYIKYKKS